MPLWAAGLWASGLWAEGLWAADAGPPAEVPSAPGISASALSSTLVLVSWTTPPEGADTYRLQRRSPAGSGIYADLVASTALNSAGDATASPSTSYGYRVAATNAAGEGAFSAEASVVTPSGAGVGGATKTTTTRITDVIALA